MIERKGEYTPSLLSATDFSSPVKILDLGMDAVELLKTYKVDISFHLTPQQISLAALETVRYIAMKRQLWSSIDTMLSDLRQEQQDPLTTTAHLTHLESLYQEAAERQAGYLKPRQIFAARDAASYFAAGYWRYTPDINTQGGQLLKSTLRRAGERYREQEKIGQKIRTFFSGFLRRR